MHRLLFSSLLVIFLSPTLLTGQTWSLEKCVTYAIDNNLLIKQAHLNTRNSELDASQSKWNRLPNVNGSVSAGYQFGRTIDPTTNAFNNTSIGFNSYSINAGAVLFDGMRINNTIKASQLDLRAARLDVQATQQNVALNVATSYLNILLSEEQLNNMQTQLELSQEQLAQTQRLIDAGQLAANNSLELKAQVARNEQMLIEAQNLLTNSYLGLKQTLQLDPSENLAIEIPALEVDEAILVRTFSADEVYQAALQSQPNIKALELRAASAMAGEQVTKAAHMPTLSVFGSLSSNYSSINPDFTNPNLDNLMIVTSDPVPVLIDGVLANVSSFSQEGITFPTTSFGNQLEENFGQSLGVSLSIPIYNNHRTRINVERARITTMNVDIQNRQAQDQLKSDVQLSVTNFYASRNAYQAAQRSLEASQAAFDDAQRRFNLGAINNFELTTAVDNLDISRTEVTRAKFQMIFNLKVVEFYLGETLSL